MSIEKDVALAERLAEAVAAEGGRAYYVGGFVRDGLLGIDNKDVDVEVHGIDVERLGEIMDSLGTRDVRGESFGVMGLRGSSLEVSVPRAEGFVGGGKADIVDVADPFVGVETAVSRRDFTVNAMMRDVLTGETLDFFGGRDDLEAGVLRHVDERTFGDDPLRAVRAAQFSARLGFAVDSETRRICSGLDLSSVAAERVWGEVTKALSRSEHPSMFFDELRDQGHLEPWFGELASVSELGGEAGWERAMTSLEGAALLRDEAENPVGFMLSATLADVGVEGACRQVSRLTSDKGLVAYVRDMVSRCGEPDEILSRDDGELDLMRMFDSCKSSNDLLLMVRSVRGERPDDDAALRSGLALYEERMASPAVMGRDLVELGAHPGPGFRKVLGETHDMALAGASFDEQLSAARDVMVRLGMVEEDVREPPEWDGGRLSSDGPSVLPRV